MCVRDTVSVTRDPGVAGMYGLLLEGICEAMKEKFGVDKWNEIREWAGVTQHAFVTHDRYSEAIVMRIARAATDLTDMQMTAVMEYCGGAFMDLLGRYDGVLRGAGGGGGTEGGTEGYWGGGY